MGRTLVHEFGHAVRLNHTGTTGNIMVTGGSGTTISTNVAETEGAQEQSGTSYFLPQSSTRNQLDQFHKWPDDLF